MQSERWRTGRRIGPSILAASVVLGALALGACQPASKGASPSTTSTTVDRSSTTTSVAPSTSSTAPAAAGAPAVESMSTRDRLAALRIDDSPHSSSGYSREDWPHWADTDRNGCDARQDALIAWSIVPATVNRTGTCKVVGGQWVSPYDLKASNNPSDFDVDHLVPLENAYESGGWQWDSTRRRAYANDQSLLVVASASSNRQKGSDAPDQWRPSNRDSWCAYADGWVRAKVKWGLTATTSERDALGRMLDTCGDGAPVWPRGGGGAMEQPSSGAAVPPPAASAAPTTPAAPPAGAEPYYANCAAARAAGVAPIRVGQPGYRTALDGDKDGIACE